MVGLRPLGSSRVDHYMLRVRIKMSSGAYATSRRDAGRGEGWQEFVGTVLY
jgi:hypothetical protein